MFIFNENATKLYSTMILLFTKETKLNKKIWFISLIIIIIIYIIIFVVYFPFHLLFLLYPFNFMFVHMLTFI